MLSLVRKLLVIRLRLEGAARGLAVYVLDGGIHLPRLSDSTIDTGSTAALRDAGLFYAFQAADPWPGRIRFVPCDCLPLQ